MTKTKPIIEDDALFEQLLTEENEWEKTRPRYTEKELFDIFPEAKSVIPLKIDERREEYKELFDTIKKKLTIIKNVKTDWGTKLFWREWIKLNDGEKLMEVDSHLSRLKRALYLIRGQPPAKSWVSEDQIRAVLAVPLENLLNQKLKRSGNVLIGLCPFHNEKHPSFYIYTKTNTCWCYGCNKGGDTITFVRLLNDCSFREAIAYLLGQK